MPYERICAYIHCQRLFFASHRRGKYCSRPCTQRQKRYQSDEAVQRYLLQHTDIPNNPDACWKWIGPLNDAGYGLACVRSRTFRAHRLVYELFVAPIPDGLDILHAPTCSLRRCVNPRHLRPGTNDDNIQDKMLAGTQARGESHPCARVNEEGVRTIRLLYQQGMTMVAIGNIYGIARLTVSDIIRYKTWKHVDPDIYTPPVPRRRRFLSKEQRDEVVTVRTLARQGFATSFIARTVHLSHQQVRNIIKRKAFADLP